MQFSLALGNAEVSNLKANSSLINFSENNFIVDSKNEFRLTWDDPNGVGSKVQPGHLLCSFESDIKITINLGKRVVPEITSRVGTISSIVLTQAYYDQNKISIINDQKSLLIRTEDEIGEFKHTVFNLQGAPITSTLENNINISHLYKGIYFLESIDSKGQKQISKFLKS
ncbi:MAG: T9SS type A sorting domain-containing protein [Saprospiraceae bacterium]|nr:T9SS type A sorting domain-containing protein [Saprospiraceae bacterium]